MQLVSVANGHSTEAIPVEEDTKLFLLGIGSKRRATLTAQSIKSLERLRDDSELRDLWDDAGGPSLDGWRWHLERLGAELARGDVRAGLEPRAKPSASARSRIGDIFEFALDPGFAYFRFVQKLFAGDVVALIDTVSMDRATISELQSIPDRWFALASVRGLLKNDFVKNIGNCKVTDVAVRGYRTRGSGHWKLYDLEGRERRVSVLSSEEARWPIDEGVGVSSMRDWITTGYDPSKDHRDMLEQMRDLAEDARRGMFLK